MVSWRSHQVLGREVCGFVSRDIDALIDHSSRHDSSRYDVEELLRLVLEVRKRFGDKGLCYAFLHHFLDRATDIVVSTASSYEMFRDSNNVCEVFAETVYRRLVNDFKNILVAIYWNPQAKPEIAGEVWEYIDHVLYELRYRRRRVLLEILSDKDFETTFRRTMIARLAKTVLSISYRMVWGTYRGEVDLESLREQEIKKFTEFYAALLECYSQT